MTFLIPPVMVVTAILFGIGGTRIAGREGGLVGLAIAFVINCLFMAWAILYDVRHGRWQ